MPRKKTTLLIVDVQQAFDVPPALVERIRKYARRFDQRVFTQFVNPPGSLFRRVLHQKSCAPGSEDTRLLVAPQPDDLVIVKQSYGLKPSDIRKLRKLGIKEVTVCGIDTDACILGVMFSLFDAGIVCRANEKLCWSSSGLHAPALQIIQNQFRGRK